MQPITDKAKNPSQKLYAVSEYLLTSLQKEESPENILEKNGNLIREIQDLAFSGQLNQVDSFIKLNISKLLFLIGEHYASPRYFFGERENDLFQKMALSYNEAAIKLILSLLHLKQVEDFSLIHASELHRILFDISPDCIGVVSSMFYRYGRLQYFFNFKKYLKLYPLIKVSVDWSHECDCFEAKHLYADISYFKERTLLYDMALGNFYCLQGNQKKALSIYEVCAALSKMQNHFNFYLLSKQKIALALCERSQNSEDDMEKLSLLDKAQQCAQYASNMAEKKQQMVSPSSGFKAKLVLASVQFVSGNLYDAKLICQALIREYTLNECLYIKPYLFVQTFLLFLEIKAEENRLQENDPLLLDTKKLLVKSFPDRNHPEWKRYEALEKKCIQVVHSSDSL